MSLPSPHRHGQDLCFGIPMVEHIDPECADVQGLVLAPTRELAVQIQEELRDLCEFKEGVRTVCSTAGPHRQADQHPEKEAPDCGGHPRPPHGPHEAPHRPAR